MAPSHDTRPVAYSINEAAAALSVSRAFIYNLWRRGELRIVKVGARSLIPAAELDRLLDESPTLAAS